MNDGLPIFVVLLTAMEAGVPIPLPSDVLLLVLGERASAGRFPLLLVVVALELVVAVGTAALFFLVRGPGQAVLARLGPRVGLTPERLQRASGLLERRGALALLVGRGWRRRRDRRSPSSLWSPWPGWRSGSAGGAPARAWREREDRGRQPAGGLLWRVRDAGADFPHLLVGWNPTSPPSRVDAGEPLSTWLNPVPGRG